MSFMYAVSAYCPGAGVHVQLRAGASGKDQDVRRRSSCLRSAARSHYTVCLTNNMWRLGSRKLAITAGTVSTVDMIITSSCQQSLRNPVIIPVTAATAAGSTHSSLPLLMILSNVPKFGHTFQVSNEELFMMLICFWP